MALIVRDVSKCVRKHLGGQTIMLDLSGEAGGTWTLGNGEPSTRVSMDALDFSIFASGRFSAAQALPKASIEGDLALAERVFHKTLVLF